VLAYKVSWPTYFAARLVLKTKHLGMPNVLAGREIVPEFIQHEARPGLISSAVLKLKDDQGARDVMLSEFDAVIARLGESGASAKAAQVVLDELNTKR
jgi:lipid-A-disaccharide synthase